MEYKYTKHQLVEMNLLKQFVLSEADRDPNQPNYSSANNNLYGEQNRLNDQDMDDGNDPGNKSINDLQDQDDIGKNQQDPNYQGLIRTVPGAHLVYKRQQEDGTYEELWIFNVVAKDRGMQRSQSIRKDILSGTDIPADKMESEDGSEQYEVWTIGNAELVKITGLAN